MNLVVRDPFRSEFGAISTLFDNVLDFPKEHGNMFVHNWNPAIDIYDSGNEVVIQAELPGIKKEDINIRVENNLLILSGKKERKQEIDKNGYYRSERGYGSFTRSYRIPSVVDSTKINAKFGDGILTLSLPKSEEAKPRQIDVKIS